MRSTAPFLVLLLLISTALADGPADNVADQVRPVPPLGIELSQADRNELEGGLAQLNKKIEQLRKSKNTKLQSLIPDVEIFSRAIRDAISHRELFHKNDITKAREVLAEGHARADALNEGNAPWTTQTGLVVRGFRSRIDDTVQPYGVVVPESYDFSGASEYRTDIWLHGRGERSTESLFIHERMNRVGKISPANTLIVHPYGRYSNAFKFAGEIDVFEALDHAKSQYRVDENRISIRGFSMGGAGCWQFAVHYPSRFFAATPGAGFSETPEFLKSFQGETLSPTWYEEKLWQLYDCTGYANNLFNLPTIAYSGELDIQKQAADIMEQAMGDQGLKLTHLIGPQTKHAIHPDSLETIESKLANLADRGRDRVPTTIDFTTYTLRYNRSFWLTVDELAEHWKRATVNATLSGSENTIRVTVDGVRGIQLDLAAGDAPFHPRQPVQIEIIEFGSNHDSESATTRQILVGPRPESDRSWHCQIHRDGDQWKIGSRPATSGIAKRHGVQGPIDDAFMDRFIIVAPTSKGFHPETDAWAKSELDHLVHEWRRQFRGDAIVKKDTEISDDDIATSHLIVFGDPASNVLLKSIHSELPIRWNEEGSRVTTGENHKSLDAANHAPVMIYPNPKNPDRYVVINSGFTYREYAYLNNARQVPKLPDWAIIDIRTPADSLWPGKVVDAGFFDEAWKMK
ncbi:putative secreted protein [Rhodopirellula maiorica SM1]|uniref:Putative secreted protein n=1 Tax=Rhodopirellula maiorica SM1 TaxID=1265738 RepID=M5RTG5_9BACT|nr:prolyl oligopeptidase family serine peptidase [Rhodopirellula maiorica]EMI22491.1 putative secreted protein [Rhodopirellula maiorica SM1]